MAKKKDSTYRGGRAKKTRQGASRSTKWKRGKKKYRGQGR
jgi:hypothetical protein